MLNLILWEAPNIFAVKAAEGYPFCELDDYVYCSEGHLTAKDVGKNMLLGKYKGKVYYDNVLHVLVEIS